eukprot:TRINITY_DN3526_c0_g1_i1.p1 TRINITY_DN3526_c0_g1~~TRINITY_DN3526_c0_g1_i1.p1  ORF type:complete len:1515 (+),score=658.37 TRINITY_DN3526_c0_g1_i1:85-4629(+)
MAEGKKRKKHSNEAENIKVFIRCRPLSQKEADAGHKSVVELLLGDGVVMVHHVVGDPDRWTFDAVINNSLSQSDIFTTWISPMVDSVVEGFNATIFAYGQSGSGKTYTMTGIMEREDLIGIIPRAFRHLFAFLKANSTAQRKFNIYCSYMELYNGKVRDLLTSDTKSLQIREHKDKTFFVEDLLQPQIKFEEDLLRHMEEGTHRRHVGATELNTDSSRSHSVFTVYVQCEEISDDGDCRSVTSKLNLVDLAGSERQSKTHASGDTLKEGCNINLSLSALGTVIDTIVKGRGHIPFRSSPLTMLLKDSLGGSSKTCMFANINPSDANISETVSTLRFADRAKQIKNKPLVQMDAKDQKIADLTAKLEELREKLKKFESGGMQALEKENEELKEKLGELQVAYDSVQEQTAREGSEAEERVNAAVRDRDEFAKKLDDLQQVQAEWEKERELLEQQIQDAASQKMELQRVMSDYIQDMSPQTHFDAGILDLSHIQSHLDELRIRGESGVSADAVEEAVTAERQKYEELLQTAAQERKQERERLMELNGQAQTSLQQALQRIEKQKAKLEKERETRKRGSEESAAAIKAAQQEHHQEVERLKGLIDGLENQLKGVRKFGALGRSFDALDTSAGSDAPTPLKRRASGGGLEESAPPTATAARARRESGAKKLCALLEEARAQAAHAAVPADRPHDREMEEAQEDARRLLQSLAPASDAGSNEALLRQELQRTLAVLDSAHHHSRGLQAELQSALQARVVELEQLLGAASARDLTADSPTLANGFDSARRHAHPDPDPGGGAAAEEQRQQLRKTSEERQQLAARLTEVGGSAELQSFLAASQAEIDGLRALQAESQRREQAMRRRLAELGQPPVHPPPPSAADANSPPRAPGAPGAADSPQGGDPGDAERVAELEAALAQSEDRLEDAAGDAERAAREADILRRELETVQHEMERLQATHAELVRRSEEERQELQGELDSARRELKEKLDLAALHSQQQMALVADIDALRAGLTKKRQEEEQMHSDIASLKAELARESKAGRLEKELEARQQSLEQTRGMLSRQKDLLNQQRKKLRELEGVVAQQEAARREREAWWHAHLEEQEGKLARLQSHHIEELQQRHRGDLRKKEDEIERLHKRLKKGQLSVQKVKERYDTKVCEYEDIIREFEEYKLRVMERDQQRERDEVVESRDEIERVIAAAKAAKALQPPRVSTRYQERMSTADAHADEVTRRQRNASAAQRKFVDADPTSSDEPSAAEQQSRRGSRMKAAAVDEHEVQQRIEKRSVAARKFSTDSSPGVETSSPVTLGQSGPMDARAMRKRVGSGDSDMADRAKAASSNRPRPGPMEHGGSMGKGVCSRTPTPPDDALAMAQRVVQPRAPFEPKPPDETLLSSTPEGLWGDNPALMTRMSEIERQQNSIPGRGSFRALATNKGGFEPAKLPSPPHDPLAIAAAAAPRPAFAPTNPEVGGEAPSMGLAPTNISSGSRRGSEAKPEIPNTSMAAILKPSNFLLGSQAHPGA